MIIFNTLSQAKSYIKRKSTRGHTEGCGCCYGYNAYKISNNKVIHFNVFAYAGNETSEATVVGRIKRL